MNTPGGSYDAQPILQYTVKKFSNFPVPSRDVTNQTLPEGELFNFSRPGRIWLVTSRMGTGKITNIFSQCTVAVAHYYLSPQLVVEEEEGDCNLYLYIFLGGWGRGGAE